VSMPRWPWPGDSPTDAARRIALAYRHKLLEAAEGKPELAAEVESLDGFWLNLGASWIEPSPDWPMNLDDHWLPAPRLAKEMNVKPKQIRDWGRRGRIKVEMICGERRYNVGDAIEYISRRRKKRQELWGDTPTQR
jgi:hypothetical protein